MKISYFNIKCYLYILSYMCLLENDNENKKMFFFKEKSFEDKILNLEYIIERVVV